MVSEVSIFTIEDGVLRLWSVLQETVGSSAFSASSFEPPIDCVLVQNGLLGYASTSYGLGEP